LLVRALSGHTKEDILFAALASYLAPETLAPKVAAIARGTYRTRSEEQVKGSGYVISSLEAALWSFWTTDNYRDAILTAVNLCDDADTTAAVCGQIAGAYYGRSGIPQAWQEKLVMFEEIKELADRLHQLAIVR
jgi:ADP-ribosyl-[dinitrogen reductase] hydrolase